MHHFIQTTPFLLHTTYPGLEIAVAGCPLYAGRCAFHAEPTLSLLQLCGVGYVIKSILQMRNHNLNEISD